jgi:serine/threonine protein kinase
MALPVLRDGETFGRYRLIEQIGVGGMAVVYRASAEMRGGEPHQVVIKRVLPALSEDPAFARMLVAEARLSARLHHPGIVELFESGRVGSEYYLAMEHVDGIDLVRLLNGCIAARRPLPLGLACYIVHEVATALSYAHDLTDDLGRSLKIVHRDVSPSNIMVTFDGRVKLLDFGVAKAAEHVSNDHTRTGTIKGKIQYLSPEQADGLPVDRRCDVFALGIVLHESLAMRRLFKGDNDLATLRLVRQAEIDPPSRARPEVPVELDRIAMKMLARDLGTRYQDCRELTAALAEIASQRGGNAAALTQFLRELGPIDRPKPSAILLNAPMPTANAAVEVVIDLNSGPTRASDSMTLKTLPVPVIEGPAAEPDRGAAPSQAVGSPRAAGDQASMAASSRLSEPRQRRRSAAHALLLGVAAVAAAGVVTVVAATYWPSLRPPALPSLAIAPPRPTSRTPVGPPRAVASPERGTLVVQVDVSAARIELDGEVVAEAARSARLPVDAQAHTLVISARRRRSVVRTVSVPAGATVEVAVKLERASSSNTKRLRDGNYLVDPFTKPR